MFELPKTTKYNKRIPKQKFYENLDISPTLKKIFVEQLRVIYWKNKIAVSTTNLMAGKEVMEIEVFEIKLNTLMIDKELLKQIDREIPYHILFLFEYQGKYQAWIGYKEAVISGNQAFKVNEYYNIQWMNEEDLPLKLTGFSLDDVYENFVRQIAGDKLKIEISGESLKESIERNKHKQTLQKKIDALQMKIRKEKQLNKQMQMNNELKRLKKELEAM